MKNILSALLLLLLASCDSRDAPTSTSGAGDIFDPFFTTVEPPGAMVIHVAREAARPGQEITLKGRVMGRLRPFVEGRAAFVLGDDTLLTPCNERPDDSCETPWDVCCDTSENKRKGTASIQVIGEDGRVFNQSLRGVNGLVELSRITVRGTVADGSDLDALIINAAAIHVHP